MADELPESAVRVPAMCYKHRNDLIVHQLQIREDGPWMAIESIAGIALFQAVAADGRVWKRAGGKQENLSLVLAEIGCPACWIPDEYQRVVRLLKKGISHASAVLQRRVKDPDWPHLDGRPDQEGADR